MNGETQSPDMSKEAIEAIDDVQYTAGYHHVFINFRTLEVVSSISRSPDPISPYHYLVGNHYVWTPPDLNWTWTIP